LNEEEGGEGDMRKETKPVDERQKLNFVL